MKKIIFLLSIFCLTVTAGDVMAAACGGTARLNGAAILARFQNKLICARSTVTTDIWAEEHVLASNGGPLWEHARGDGNPIDPRRQAGTWAIGSNPSGTIIYNYTGNPSGNPFEWSVWNSPNTIGGILFCTADGSSSIATAGVINMPDPAAANPCGFTLP